ncbi:MAG: hypothetical protein J2P23_07790 [Microlunatus sp.]|nr:hypothetical protein [Microlunatus sp.]
MTTPTHYHPSIAARSTVAGWQPTIGQLVWETIYSPAYPDWHASIEERIVHGSVYQPRHLMRVHGITPDYVWESSDGKRRGPVTRWFLRDPSKRLGSPLSEGLFPTNGLQGPSWIESDWAVLEDASDQEAGDVQEALF